MIRKVWEKYKNILIKGFCYLVVFCLILLSFNFSFHNLFRKESSLVSAQKSNEKMEIVTNDSYEILGNISRTIPETFGVYTQEEYPSSLYVLTTGDQEKRKNIYNENIEMYEDIESAINENRLKKHISADGQFWGSVSDDAPGIIKKTYVNASVKRYHSLGIYAPAGEILTIEIDESLINKGLSIVIGYEVEANKIPLDKFLVGNKDRMPIIRKSFNLTSTTTKVGTPLGGNVYLHVNDNVNKDFEITVSGGVDNPVFQLGINSEEDYKKMLETPGLIMEFKLPHVRLIMPKSYALSDNIIGSLELWHKMSSLSTYAMNKLGNTMPITHYYDSYVPAGAAVAYVGANFSILPLGWGTNSLNYEMQMSGGNWGNFHEFNHHYQSGATGKWGLNNPGEVTNNVLTVMSYLLYTDIASTRSETVAPGNFSSGWNVSSDPYYNFKRVMDVSSSVTNFEEFSTNQLYMYADLMHAFGVDKFMELIRSSYGLVEGYETNLMSDVDSFALRASEIFESDLTYYLVNICKMNLQEETITTIKNMNYDPYLPLYNLYSNGVKNINTGRTYYLNENTYVFDFNKYTISPLEYEIKEIKKPKYGRLKENEDGTYSYSNSYNKKDTFSITYLIKYNDKEYLKTLDFEIDFLFDKANIKTYSTSYNNISNALSNIKDEDLISEDYTSGINYNAVNGVNLSISKGKLKVNKSGNYTFAVYGDDQVRFNLNDKEANTTTYSSSINLDDEKTYFTVYLNKDKFYDYTLYCLNTGGAGNARVVYSYEEENDFINIDNDYIYSRKATKENSEKTINNYDIVYDVSSYLVSNKYGSSTINKIESITTTANANDDSLVENMFDGDKTTAFHTAWKSNITKFPHEYIIKFDKTALFDNINIYFTGDRAYYAIGEYEVHISNDNKNYTLIKEDRNTGGFLNINFEKTQKAKYIKIIVKSNANNQSFTSINEIEVGVSFNANEYNYYAANNDNLHYIDKWDLKYTNNHFNGVTSKANKNSKLEFYFTGRELAIYTSSNSKYRIKIGNGNWVNVASSGDQDITPYIAKDLKNKKYRVVIEALNDNMSLEMIGVKGILEDRNIYSLSFIEFYKIIGGITLTIVLIQGSYFVYKERVISKGIKKVISKLKELL